MIEPKLEGLFCVDSSLWEMLVLAKPSAVVFTLSASSRCGFRGRSTTSTVRRSFIESASDSSLRRRPASSELLRFLKFFILVAFICSGCLLFRLIILSTIFERNRALTASRGRDFFYSPYPRLGSSRRPRRAGRTGTAQCLPRSDLRTC